MQNPAPTARDFPPDARALSLPERRAWANRLDRDNRAWLERLRTLAEVRLQPDFPAFLLATPRFARLAGWLGTATSRRDLATAITDELDRFVDAYGDYLRTRAGEDVFAGTPAPRTC